MCSAKFGGLFQRQFLKLFKVQQLCTYLRWVKGDWNVRTGLEIKLQDGTENWGRKKEFEKMYFVFLLPKRVNSDEIA